MMLILSFHVKFGMNIKKTLAHIRIPNTAVIQVSSENAEN